MRRLLVLGYGVTVYAAMLAVFVALFDFVGRFGLVRSIDAGPTAPTATALAIDLGLVALFGVTHSVLARPQIKRALAGVIPPVAERSTYVLVASATLALIIWQWRAMPSVLWHVAGPARAVLWTLHGFGALVLLYATFLTDHFDLFGLRQVWLYYRGRPYTPVPFVERSLYRHVRHPMMVGLIVWLWSVPTMTVGSVVFAATMTAYILVGIGFEERGLARELGEPYAEYRRRVPMLLPRARGSRPDRSPRPA